MTRTLNQLRADGYALATELLRGEPSDTDELIAFIRDVFEVLGAGLTDDGEPDRVALLSVWATSMYARSKAIEISITPQHAGIMLRASLPGGVQIEPRHEGGPVVHTLAEHPVEQLIFWNDSRPNSWLRMLCENRAEQLLDEAYYAVTDRPPKDGPDHG